MASEFQIAANRLNAQSSSGPRTEEGKATSSRNALTHGLTGRIALLSGEDPEEYRSLLEGLIAGFRPDTTLEHELVARIASVLWRLRRVPAFEAALMAWLEASVRDRYSRLSPRISREPGRVYDPVNEEEQQQLVLGKTIESFLEYDLSGKLGRYETSLQRQLSALLKELRVLQARRKDATEGEDARRKPA